MRRSDGFTLLEVLLSLLLTTILSLAFFTLLQQFQSWVFNLNQLFERDENLELAPLLFSRLVLGAGNRPDGAPGREEAIQVRDDQLELRSDNDGNSGFPDGRLDSPFEWVTLRSRDPELQIRSGRGSFQPLLKHVDALDSVTFDAAVLTLKLRARTPLALAVTGSRDERTISLSFYLWNYRPNLFLESP